MNQLMKFVGILFCVFCFQGAHGEYFKTDFKGKWHSVGFDKAWLAKNFSKQKIANGGVMLMGPNAQTLFEDYSPCSPPQPLVSFFKDSKGKVQIYKLDCVSSCPKKVSFGRLARIRSIKLKTVKDKVQVQINYGELGYVPAGKNEDNGNLMMTKAKLESTVKVYSLSDLRKDQVKGSHPSCI